MTETGKRIRKSRTFDLNVCICGSEVSEAEIKEGDTIMRCKVPGCETEWVCKPHPRGFFTYWLAYSQYHRACMMYDFAPKNWSCPSCKGSSTTSKHRRALWTTSEMDSYFPHPSMFNRHAICIVYARFMIFSSLKNMCTWSKLPYMEGEGGSPTTAEKKKNWVDVGFSCSATPLPDLQFSGENNEIKKSARVSNSTVLTTYHVEQQ